MDFPGFAHIALTVSNYDQCLKFYDRLMTHLGMRRYVESSFFCGWYAAEYMFVIAHAAPAGDRFSQFRSGLHHLSFRARSRGSRFMLRAAQGIRCEDYSCGRGSSVLAGLLLAAVRRSRRHTHRDELHSRSRLAGGRHFRRRDRARPIAARAAQGMTGSPAQKETGASPVRFPARFSSFLYLASTKFGLRFSTKALTAS